MSHDACALPSRSGTVPPPSCALPPSRPGPMPSFLIPSKTQIVDDVLSDEERTATVDFRLNLLGTFGGLEGDKWDQSKWEAAVATFKAKYPPATIDAVFRRAMLPGWDAVEKQLRKGPPKFMQPGWHCPLIGTKVDLAWLDGKKYDVARAGAERWRDKKVLVLFFWAAWCRPCWAAFPLLQQIASAHASSVQVIAFNIENVFTRWASAIDSAAVARFVRSREDMRYPACVDVHGVAMDALFFRSEYLAIPSVFIITLKDDVVRWVGPPTGATAPLEAALRVA